MIRFKEKETIIPDVIKYLSLISPLDYSDVYGFAALPKTSFKSRQITTPLWHKDPRSPRSAW